MPNVNPNGPGVAPGVVTDQGKYPQWGVGGGTPGSAAGWKVVQADSAAQKQADIGKGFVVWFSSKSAAQDYMKSEQSAYSSGEPQNAIPGLAAIGDFFARLTEGNTWIRLAEGLLGVILIAVGIARITRAVPVATQIARAVK